MRVSGLIECCGSMPAIIITTKKEKINKSTGPNVEICAFVVVNNNRAFAFLSKPEPWV